jgi:hypothetical protein
MSVRLPTLAPTLALLLTLLAAPAFAAPPPAYDQSDDRAPPAHDVIGGQHVEGHIAFLRTELGITPAQEELWNAVTDAMRQDVRDMNNAERQVARQDHSHETAVQYLQNRSMFAQLRAQGEVRFFNAFAPLYNALSSHQKQVADDLLITTGREQQQ